MYIRSFNGTCNACHRSAAETPHNVYHICIGSLYFLYSNRQV